MVRAEEDGVAVCTGLIAGHRSTDVPMRERERERERVGRAKGETEDSPMRQIHTVHGARESCG